MSHFPILVIGEDPEEQLAPFDENMAVEPYLDSVAGEWKTALDKAKDHFPNTGWTDKQLLDSWAGVGYWTPARDGSGEWEHWSRYNPKSKWDWYVTGGRWDGFLPKLNGTKVNECTIGDLDLEILELPHAILRDGQWIQTGEMGWWGVVRDAKNEDAWAAEVRQALSDLPPETKLTAIDCHI